jgi:hypothetical protein
MSWAFTAMAGWRSGYFKVSGIAVPGRPAARPVLRPPPTPTRPAVHFPGSPVIRRHAPAATSAGRRAGEGLPSSRRHYLDVPRPIRRRVPDGCASRLFTASMAFTVIAAARLPLPPPSRARPLTTLQASRHAADRPVAPPYRAFDAGLRPRPFPDDTASLLTGPPGSYPGRTHTGKRRRAYEREEHHGTTSRCHLPPCWAHENTGLPTTRRKIHFAGDEGMTCDGAGAPSERRVPTAAVVSRLAARSRRRRSVCARCPGR